MKIWIFCIFCIITGLESFTDNTVRSFRDDFMFGAASSAYQVEGGWDADGKGESIWDKYLHDHPEVIVDGVNGDVAADSYNNYKRDVQMLRELGVDFYRFSVSWPRVLPTGLPNNINEKGIEYYDNLINELLKYNIEPMVTLYHLDLPQKLEELGGWSNPLSVDWFESYAKVLYDRYASKVKYWITVNQPNSICIEGYGDSLMAPAVNLKGIADYLCMKNVLLAHAKAYRLYEREYKKKYNGMVGISLALNWVEPVNNKTENVRAAEIYRDFTIGITMNPIWSKEGDFPWTVRDIIAKKSKEQGYPRSRLPTFTPEEKALLKGSSDFVGMNHYTTFLVSPSKNKWAVPSFADDVSVDVSYGEMWKQGKSVWLKSFPFGIYKTCNYLNQQYDYPPIIITEHGWSTDPGLRDQDRVDNMRGYLIALLYAIEDGADVRGYTAWSLMDNVEWTAGTSERFGLYEVDFNSEDKKRTARLSALAYRRIINKRVVEDGWTPKSLKITANNRRMKKLKQEL